MALIVGVATLFVAVSCVWFMSVFSVATFGSIVSVLGAVAEAVADCIFASCWLSCAVCASGGAVVAVVPVLFGICQGVFGVGEFRA